MENVDSRETLLLEGISAVSALIKASELGTARRRIIRVMIGKKKFSDDFRRVRFICSAAERLGFEVVAAPDGDGPDAAKGGYSALVTPAVYPGLEELRPEHSGYSALIEGAEDPYTLAHSIRSLYLCGANSLILPRPLPDGADAVIARASAGTSELLPIFVCPVAEAVSAFRTAGYSVAAAAARDAADCDRAEIKFPLLLIAGGEKRGITRKTLDLCDYSLKIPYGRDALCSLATESAVSVLAYELNRRIRKKDVQ